VGEVRGLGLIGAIELVADKETHANFDPARKVGARLAKHCEQNGVISRALAGDVLAFSPPLIITEADIDQMLDGVARALDELHVQLREEQVSAVEGP
jgi:4-aminobutyrate--pyruvate transaminase